MEDLADTSALLEETISRLMTEPEKLTAEDGVALADQWIKPLQSSENTKSIGDEVQKLKALLQGNPVNSEHVNNQMNTIAEKVALLAPDMGTEGEMPSLLTALATALRMSGESAETKE